MRFDLEDGQEPVSFSLNPEDAERFVKFMAECHEHRQALELLVKIKDHKDEHGKDEWYQESQPMAWDRARKALES
jgi:hypothetical protein